jgi:hypothetical protein
MAGFSGAVWLKTGLAKAANRTAAAIEYRVMEKILRGIAAWSV